MATTNSQNSFSYQIQRFFVRLLIGQENLKLYDSADWPESSDFDYPAYYRKQNFHGISGGYLNAIAPVTYDAITRFAAPPHERRQREAAIASIVGQPPTILDLGCGTGSSTLMLKQAFPQADVIGLELSAHMLTMARHKGNKAQLEVRWQQGLAEATPYAEESFDLISIAFLFHETPVPITKKILQECQRLLKPDGQMIILDGNQQRLRHTPWLIKFFREPYARIYAQGNINHWLTEAGFANSQTRAVGWVSQLTSCFKSS